MIEQIRSITIRSRSQCNINATIQLTVADWICQSRNRRRTAAEAWWSTYHGVIKVQQVQTIIQLEKESVIIPGMATNWHRQQLHYATTLGTIMTVIVINGTRTISLTIFFFVFPPAPPQWHSTLLVYFGIRDGNSSFQHTLFPRNTIITVEKGSKGRCLPVITIL